jgi:hypothetical protein
MENEINNQTNLVNRIGKLYIPELVLRNSIMFNQGLYQFIMNELDFIVMRCEFLGISNQFEYAGYSKYFKIIEEATEPTCYDAIITITTDEEKQNAFTESIYILERGTENKIEIFSRKEEIKEFIKNNVTIARDENEKQ